MESGVLSAWRQHEVTYDLVAQSSDLMSSSSLMIYDYVIEGTWVQIPSDLDFKLTN